MRIISGSGWLTGAGCGSATQLSLMDLGSGLREIYGAIAAEALPESLAALLQRLDHPAQHGLGTEGEAEISDRPRNSTP
jgi:hypothetical protein